MSQPPLSRQIAPTAGMTAGEAARSSFVERHFPYLLIIPILGFMFALVLFPLVYSLGLSLTSFSPARPAWAFIGLRNYQRLLADPAFWGAVQNTAVFVVGTVAAEMVLGYILALLLSRQLRGAGVIRTAFLLPVMIAPVLAGFQFRFFFNDQFGMLNNLLLVTGLLERPIAWLGVGHWPMVSVMAASIWRSTPFVAMILLAGLMALPREPYEAAAVDGASPWQQFRYLTFPLLLPLALLALSIRLLDAPRVFDLVYMLTEGGPANKTEMLLIYIYREAWQSFQLGYAAAASYLMLLLQMALLAAQMRLVWRLREWR